MQRVFFVLFLALALLLASIPARAGAPAPLAAAPEGVFLGIASAFLALALLAWTGRVAVRERMRYQRRPGLPTPADGRGSARRP